MDLPLSGTCQCGSILYEVCEPPIVTLDDTSSIKPDAHVWTSHAQAWVNISTDIPGYEAQPDAAVLLKAVVES